MFSPMKFISILTSILFFFSFLKADSTEIPHVLVTGTAIVEVVPDEMHWSLQLTTIQNSVAATAEAHDSHVSTVLSFLKENDISEEDTKTSRISITENWVYRNNNRVKEGYKAMTTVTFKSKDLEDYRSLWIGLSKLKDVEVSSVTFDTSDRIRHQNESRLKAVTAAKEKVVAMAGALDSLVHEPLAILEDQAGNTGYNFRAVLGNFSGRSGESAESGTSISPGAISITTRVNVKFRISSN